jgi:hypothetical protein
MQPRAAVVVAVVAFALAVSAVPVSKRRLEAMASTTSEMETTRNNPAAPLLSSSFHVKYSIYALNHEKTLLPSLTNLIDRASKLLDGEAWQNVATDGAITIKTVTKPTMIGRILTSAMTQVWVKDHGWTLKNDGKCTADTLNTQLVIPGTILRESGVFKGTIDLKPIEKIVGSKIKAAKDGSYKVDQWDATLPNDEGSVTYYLYTHTTTPLMSNYRLKGKPSVWAQYKSFEAVTNPDSEYVPVQACAAAAAAGAKAPATTTLAKMASVAAAAHAPKTGAAPAPAKKQI